MIKKNHESKHKPVKVCYDLYMFERFHSQLALYIDLVKCLHWLICGNSGSGKSYMLLFVLRNILAEFQKDIKVWFCDFKSSEDFSFMIVFAHFYTGADCARGLEEFYTEYQQVKNGTIRDGLIRLIIFDEWAGFMVYETQKNKKQAEQYKGWLLEVLLMGRSMLCGVWVVMQRNDAKYIEGREQFFVTVALGKMSREMKLMIMQGEELKQREVYACGEGIIRCDTFGTKFIKVPKLRDVNLVKQQIMDCLMQADDAEGGGGEASGHGTPTA